MPLTNDLRAAEIGFALGASASSPTYALPLLSGLPVPRQGVETIDAAGPLAVAQDARKSELAWGGSISVPVLPLSIGLLAKAILWGESVASSTHTITPGTTQQFVTAFSRRPGDLYEKWATGVVETLSITASAGDPLMSAEVGLLGLTSTVTSPYSATTTEAASSALQSGSGTTIQVNFGSGNATRTNVSGASVRLSRPAILAGDMNSPTPTRIDHEPLRAEVALTLLFSDYAAYRAAFYGGESGSTLSSTVGEGSVSLAFSTGGASVTIAVPRVAWNVDAPEASGDGGPVTATANGIGLLPASGAFTTVTVVNSRSTAY